MRSFLQHHTAAATFFVTFLCASIVFAAQAATPPPAGASTLQALWIYAAPTLAVIGAFGVLMTVLGHLVLLIPSRYPKLVAFGHALVALGGDVGKFVKSASVVVGKDTPPSPPPPAARTGASVLSSAMAMAMVIIACGLTSVGCSGLASVFQNVTTNPVVAASAFEEAIGVANSIAQATWAIVFPLIPASAQPQALAAFTRAEDTVTDGLAAIDAAKSAYADGTSQDWTKLYADATKAFDATVALIDLYTTTQAAAATQGLIVPKATLATTNFASARARLATASVTVHRYH